MMRSTLTTLTLFVFLSALIGLTLAADGVLEINQACAVSTGCFAGDTPGLPVTIAASGSYVLTGELTTTTDGIAVGADHVTLDLNGFSVNGGSGDGVRMDGRSNVEIRNGTIRGFGGAGIIDRNSSARNHRVLGMRLIGNGQADIGGASPYSGVRLDGRDHQVRDCTIEGNGSDGIHGEDNMVVTHNTISDNGFDGIDVGLGAVVEWNVSLNNADTGISAGIGSVVRDNTARGNAGTGIAVDSGSTVIGNTAGFNHNGISAASDVIVIYNNAEFNQSTTGFGISVSVRSSVVDNISNNNGGWGIRAQASSKIVGNTVSSNNQSQTAGFGGITVDSTCMVRENMLSGNGVTEIFVNLGANVLENNVLHGSTSAGIVFNFNGNFFANNRASGFLGNAYVNSAGQTDGGGNVSF